ncbi:MAG: hypothetical protein A3F16_07220 [Deltaproteobacteria bacterium RIFCSPHIGHO2_12_FULL_43_9]|nr:MAG: hypothetical protein A3F16_07220 [Deltaproteobacteria bacterium RIFCSPHIGHO2_12_FULL_43_9]
MKLKEAHWWFIPIPLFVFITWGILDNDKGLPILQLDKSLPGHYERIITLAPSLTEMVSAIGGSPKIVGITESCDFPPEVLDRPRVANHAGLYLEKILSLKPDLILAHGDDFISRESLNRLSELRVRVVLVPQPSLNEIPDVINRLGLLLQLEYNATRLADKLRSDISEIKNMKFSQNYKVLIQLERTPLYVAGTNNLISNIVEALGGKNITRDLSLDVPYPRISIESVLSLNPEIILIPISNGDSSWFSKMKSDWERFPTIAAVENDRVCLLNASTIVRPGPRILEGINEIIRCVRNST